MTSLEESVRLLCKTLEKTLLSKDFAGSWLGRSASSVENLVENPGRVKSVAASGAWCRGVRRVLRGCSCGGLAAGVVGACRAFAYGWLYACWHG
jgi:hypothetical protein